MRKFEPKGSISDEDFMIHLLNDLNVILDGIVNHLISSGDNALTT